MYIKYDYKLVCVFFYSKMYLLSILIMVLILDGYSLRGAHVRSNIYYSTCIRRLMRLRAVTNRIF